MGRRAQPDSRAYDAYCGGHAGVGARLRHSRQGERRGREGRYGLDQNPQEATRWYREMQKCGDSHTTTDAYRERAAAWLRDHP